MLQQKEHKIVMYWDYRDELSEEQIMKILLEEDGLNDVENDIYENNIDYVLNLQQEYLKDYPEEEREAIIDNLIIDINIEQLLRNSRINLRLSLQSNEDGIYMADTKNSDCLKAFKKRFKNCYDKKEFEKEIQNATCDYANMTFYFRISGKDILALREQIKQGYIQLKKGLSFGLFNSWIGSGSLLDMVLKKEVMLRIKDWRAKSEAEEVLNALKSQDKCYYSVGIVADNSKNVYGIKETYGLGSFQEW